MIDGITEDLFFLLRLVVAAVLGAVLGYEREVRDRPAGLRTHIIVCVSAALILTLAETIARKYASYSDAIRIDPIRAVEGVVAGISFLGAGTIFFAQKEDRVKGLTTAASVLATSAIGMACGLERYTLAVGATGLVLLVLTVLARLERRVGGSRKATE